jgi:hypothetical protein
MVGYGAGVWLVVVLARLKKCDRLCLFLESLKLGDRKCCDSSNRLKWDIFLKHL